MFLIRADGNAKIGAGHLMRCLTIGTELEKQGNGEELLFLCADEPSADLVRQHGFQTYVLGTDYRDMESELPVWEKLLNERAELSAPVILVDSYYVTDRYLDSLRRFGFVVLLDDMGTKRYPVDGIINYNAYADSEYYRELYRGTAVKLFIGSKFTPVREQFLYGDYQVRSEVQSVLITTGGGDSENIAGKILKMLYDENLEYHLIVGQFNPHYRELKQLEGSRKNIYIHSNVTDMAGMMKASDLAITAGGSTVYELSALGVPFICFSYAENQEALTEYIGSLRVAGFAGAFHKSPERTLECIRILFGKLVTDENLRRQYSESEKRLIDGRGASRLAQALQSPESGESPVCS